MLRTRTAVLALSLLSVLAAQRAPLPAGDVTSLEELRALEKHSRELHAKIAPLVCSVRTASGVLVEGGLVLTAAHVIDRPGRTMPIVLADGRRFEGKALGVDERSDAGIVRLTVPEGTELPAARLGDSKGLEVGQWVWMFGHPGSRKPYGAPLRFGRVLRNDPNWIVTDCEMSGGDSGGPLFDHEGRLIGIHSRITQRLDVNMHVPIAQFVTEWERLLAGEHLRRGTPRRSPESDEDEMPEAEQETEATAGAAQERERARRLDRRDVLRAAEPVCEALQQSVVEFVVVGRRKVLGTVVAGGGRVLTKASEISELTRARLPDGKIVDFEVLAVDASDDLALVRVPAELTPVEFAEERPVPGDFLLSADAGAVRPLALGVLSVSERAGLRRAWIGIRFGAGDGIRIDEVLAGTPAEQAGLQRGDVLVAVDGEPMKERIELLQLLAQKSAGERLVLALRRGAEDVRVDLTLGTHPDRHGPVSRQQRLGLFGVVSDVRQGFSRVLQHDSRLSGREVGGPVVDLRGRVVGINIARVGRVDTLALPSAAVKAALVRLASGGSDPRQEKLD